MAPSLKQVWNNERQYGVFAWRGLVEREQESIGSGPKNIKTDIHGWVYDAIKENKIIKENDNLYIVV